LPGGAREAYRNFPADGYRTRATLGRRADTLESGREDGEEEDAGQAGPAPGASDQGKAAGAAVAGRAAAAARALRGVGRLPPGLFAGNRDAARLLRDRADRR